MQLRFESEVARRWDFEIAYNGPCCSCLSWLALPGAALFFSRELRRWSILNHNRRRANADARTLTNALADADASGPFCNHYMVRELLG
jgi:hypothetical protein